MKNDSLKKFALLFIIALERVNCAINKTEDFVKNNEKSDARLIPPPPPFEPSLLFPVNAATGILVAIAIPVTGLAGQNVFVSYNFEANYNMANIPSDAFPGPIKRFPGLKATYPAVDSAADADYSEVIARKIGEELEFEDETTEIVVESEELHKVVTRSVTDDSMVFTRRGVYQLIESRLDASGISGKKCLLLAICDSAKFPFLDHNGVIGHVFHIILSPSSSMDENLPTEYMKAENLGKSGNCRKYENHCNFNVLNVISKLF